MYKNKLTMKKVNLQYWLTAHLPPTSLFSFILVRPFTLSLPKNLLHNQLVQYSKILGSLLYSHIKQLIVGLSFIL